MNTFYPQDAAQIVQVRGATPPEYLCQVSGGVLVATGAPGLGIGQRVFLATSASPTGAMEVEIYSLSGPGPVGPPIAPSPAPLPLPPNTIALGLAFQVTFPYALGVPATTILANIDGAIASFCSAFVTSSIAETLSNSLLAGIIKAANAGTVSVVLVTSDVSVPANFAIIPGTTRGSVVFS